MSQLFGAGRGFEDRLDLAFRGDAGEQKKRRKEFDENNTPFRLRQGAANLGKPNIFKNNLGGTGRVSSAPRRLT